MAFIRDPDYKPNLLVPGTSHANSLRRTRIPQPTQFTTNSHYPAFWEYRWKQTYAKHPQELRLAPSETIIPVKWRHNCQSPGVEATFDSPHLEGTLHEKCVCIHPGCGYVTDGSTVTVSATGLAVETMSGRNLVKHRFHRRWMECCKCGRAERNRLDTATPEGPPKQLGVDCCVHCKESNLKDLHRCLYCVAYNFFGEPIEFMDGTAFPFGPIWKHLKAGGTFTDEDRNGKAPGARDDRGMCPL
ncbi:hypothetical protein VTI74DRAFT_5011 [Chaetomium olivicolor]